MDIYSINGRFVDPDEAKISVNDLSVIRGYGVFDLLRTYHKHPFHLHDHLIRLQTSARLIGLQPAMAVDEMEHIVTTGLQRSTHGECTVRIVLTGGLSEDGITPGNDPQLLVLITAAAKLPASCYLDGVKVITRRIERFLPGAKSINYIPAIVCQQQARAQGAMEAIYVDRDGYLLEGTTSNIFAFCGNTLITPPLGRVLPGITRKVTLELAKKSFNVEERPIHSDEIRLLEETLMTSSIRELMPISAIDGITIGDGTPGRNSRHLMSLFADYTSRYHQSSSA